MLFKGRNFVSLRYQAGELALSIAAGLVRKNRGCVGCRTGAAHLLEPLHQERVPAENAARGPTGAAPAAGGLPLPAGLQLIRFGREHDLGAGPGPPLRLYPGK